jgi:uncharacterized protein YdeI (YjbR/CyaY-like superfamily)
MNVLIISIEHTFQLISATDDAAEIKEKKQALERLLREEMSIRTYGCVLEESKREKLSIAKALADEHRPSVPWRNITMNEQERRTAGIAEALRNRPCRPDWDDLQRSIEFRIPADLTAKISSLIRS